MKIKECIINFLNGYPKEGKASSVWYRNDKLFSYNTCICQKHDTNFYVNKTQYSVSSTKHLNILNKELSNNSNVIYLDNVTKNTCSLV